jgi:hypothetical protein
MQALLLVEPSGIEPLTSTLPVLREHKLNLLIYIDKTGKTPHCKKPDN